MVAIQYADLHAAFEFVSFGAPLDCSAFICVDTGLIYCTSDTLELDAEVPEDLETSDRYIAIASPEVSSTPGTCLKRMLSKSHCANGVTRIRSSPARLNRRPECERAHGEPSCLC